MFFHYLGLFQQIRVFEKNRLVANTVVCNSSGVVWCCFSEASGTAINLRCFTVLFLFFAGLPFYVDFLIQKQQFGGIKMGWCKRFVAGVGPAEG